MNAGKVRNAAVTAGLCLSMTFGTLPVTAIAEQAQSVAPTASQEAAAQHKFSFVDADHGNETVGGWTTTLEDALSYNPVDGTHEWKADGYKFLGWSFANNGEVNSYDELKGLSGDITPYAVWQKADSSTNQQDSVAHVKYYDSLNDTYEWEQTAINGLGWYFDPQANGAMTHDGYTFAGWSYDPQGNYPVSEDTTLAAGDIALYAQWKQNPVAKSHILFRDSLAEDFDSSLISENTFDEGDVDWSMAVPTKDGYTFAGWAYNQDGSDPVAAGTVLPVGDVTLWAQWTKNEDPQPEPVTKHTVTFVNRGTVIQVSQVEDGQVLASTPQVDSVDGYTFVGWTTDQNSYTGFDFAQPITSDVVVYAWYTKNAVDNSDKTNVPGVQKTTNVESGSTTVDQGGAKSDDKSDDKALPQTSDSMPVAAVAGFGVLGSLVAAAGAFLKRRNN